MPGITYQQLKASAKNVRIFVPDQQYVSWAGEISTLISESARKRGTGIATRPVEYIASKIENGLCVLALSDNALVGFCYIESWDDNKYVANSGLVVAPEFRGLGIAKRIKRSVFQLTAERYPNARLISITTSGAVMKMNTELGYSPVTFSELAQDDAFWTGCRSCPNHDVLQRLNRKMCLCTAMRAPSHNERMALDLSHKILNYEK